MTNDSSTIPAQRATTEQQAESKKAEMYVPVPNDASGKNQACPVCREGFATSWQPEMEEWVWKGAVRVGVKVYHSSCWAEAGAVGAGAKGAGGEKLLGGGAGGDGAGDPPSRGRTPEINIGDLAAILKSVKRKAEVSLKFPPFFLSTCLVALENGVNEGYGLIQQQPNLQDAFEGPQKQQQRVKIKREV